VKLDFTPLLFLAYVFYWWRARGSRLVLTRLHRRLCVANI